MSSIKANLEIAIKSMKVTADAYGNVLSAKEDMNNYFDQGSFEKLEELAGRIKSDTEIAKALNTCVSFMEFSLQEKDEEIMKDSAIQHITRIMCSEENHIARDFMNKALIAILS